MPWRSLAGAVRRNPLILPFYLPSLLLSLSYGLLVPVLPLYAKELDAAYTLVGLVLAGEAVGMLLGDVPAGLLIRRLGHKRTMLLGATCAGAATTALFAAPTVLAAVALRIVAGFGHALFGVSQHAYVAGAASTGSRGRALALYGGLTRVGSFVGPMAGGLIAAAYGLRPTFLVFGATNIALLSAVICFVQAPAQPSGAVQPAPPGGHLWRTLREHYRPLGIAGVGQLLAQTIRAGRAAVIPLYAADVLGLDVQAIGAILSLTAAVDMSLFYPAGWIMDHLGRKYAILPSFGIQALGMFLIPFTGSFVGLLLAAMLIGLGNGIGAGCMMTLGADLAPQHTRGEFLGLWRLIGDVGHTGGPMVVGQVADLVALPTAAWAIAAAGLCAALIFGLLVNEPNPNGAAGRRARAVQP